MPFDSHEKYLKHDSLKIWLFHTWQLLDMGLNARKSVFGLQTTQEQTSLSFYTVWSASLLFAIWKKLYINLLLVKFQISSLSLYLMRLVWNWLCRKSWRQVMSHQGSYSCALSIATLVLCHDLVLYIWAWTWENLSSGVWEHQRGRPASVQSDQRLCCSLFRKYHILTCYERNFNFLASLCSWAGWFESHFVRNPKDRFSRLEAHMMKLYSCIFKPYG